MASQIEQTFIQNENRYKGGIFQKLIPEIHCGTIDLRLSGIVGIDRNILTR